jgi:hypothetical protein
MQKKGGNVYGKNYWRKINSKHAVGRQTRGLQRNALALQRKPYFQIKSGPEGGAGF